MTRLRRAETDERISKQKLTVAQCLNAERNLNGVSFSSGRVKAYSNHDGDIHICMWIFTKSDQYSVFSWRAAKL